MSDALRRPDDLGWWWNMTTDGGSKIVVRVDEWDDDAVYVTHLSSTFFPQWKYPKEFFLARAERQEAWRCDLT